jgi:hypothetical protein
LPHHLLHFNPDTLRRLLETHGLRVRDLRMVGQAGWMRRSLATVRSHQEGNLLDSLGRWRLVCSLLTRWSVWNNAADCLQVIAYRPEGSVSRSIAAA